MTATTVFDLYRSPINVWVEDNLTRLFLTELWQDSQIHILHAAGANGVRHMVKAAEGMPNLRGHVLGIVDRDFGPDNLDRWPDRTTKLFTLPVHETENLLLDFEILGALSKSAPAEILAAAHRFASDQKWWLIGKAVVRELCQDLSGNMPADPPKDLHDAATLRDWLRALDYWPTHQAHCTRWQDDAHRTVRLQALEAEVDTFLASGDWRTRFSGKEIFRHLRSHVSGLDQTPKRQPSSQAERDEDLMKRIAREMRAQSKLPAALATLHRSLRERIKAA